MLRTLACSMVTGTRRVQCHPVFFLSGLYKSPSRSSPVTLSSSLSFLLLILSQLSVLLIGGALSRVTLHEKSKNASGSKAVLRTSRSFELPSSFNSYIPRPRPMLYNPALLSRPGHLVCRSVFLQIDLTVWGAICTSYVRSTLQVIAFRSSAPLAGY